MSEAADRQKERSRLLNKHKDERTAAEKSMKKLKGNMKEKGQKDFEEMEERHAAELAEFDGAGGPAGGDDKKSKKSKDKEEEIIYFPNRNWDGYSKKELEEAGVERGIGKKGSKEDLVCKLIAFHSELDTKLAANPEAAAKAKAKAEKAANANSDDEDEDDEDEEDEEDSSGDEDDDAEAKEALSVSPEEAEKQFKREQLVRKAIRHVLLKSGPVAVDELPKALEEVVKNFTPAICGYSSLRKFCKNQPKKFMIFKKKEMMLYPPKE